MVTRLYALHDSKAKAYQQPFYQMNDGLALRMVQDAMTDGKQMFCRHPEDYSLWFLGEFDDETGLLQSPDTGPAVIIQLVQLVPEHQAEPLQMDLTDPEAANKIRNLRNSYVQGGK